MFLLILNIMLCTSIRHVVIGVAQAVNSNQAALRHTKGITYRCFLPDLAGFVTFRCARPDFHHHLLKTALQAPCLQEDLNPAIADCRLQDTATFPSSTANFLMAERAGLEPAGPFSLTRFPGVPLSHSDTSPNI
jgi:hypothetical protein